jgi:outer membrane protein
MKKIFAFLLLLAGFASGAHAQRFAYVDTEYILEQIPEYRSAQKKLDQMAEDWQKEIERQKAQIDKMRRELQAEQVLLTDEQRKKKEQQIEELEKKGTADRRARKEHEGIPETEIRI